MSDLNCKSNLLKSIDISNNIFLTKLVVWDNKLNNLDVHNNKLLEYLDCDVNGLNALDVSENIKLTNLYCNNNQLSIIDVSVNKDLVEFQCRKNSLSIIDISQNINLTSVRFDYNNIETLDFSQNTQLTNILCNNNQLKTLDVSTNKLLSVLDCTSNQITNLDLSENFGLNYLNCSSNQLLTLNVKNGNNTLISKNYFDANNNLIISFNASDNQSLTCIEVDDPLWSGSNWSNIDPQTSFSSNCYYDDGDGVMNNVDKCPNTINETNVDANGCFTLPANNFNIQVISETCPNKNNGQLVITANEPHDYVATIGGTAYTFTNSKTITDLQPRTYTVCITVTGVTFEQCYHITVEEGTTVSGKSSVKENKATVELDKGTPPFKVFVNGNEVLDTDNPIFSVAVKHGDLLEVKTAKECEGVYSKAINLIDGIVVYSNPTNGKFETSLPNTLKEISIELFTISSQLISKAVYHVYNGKVQLSLENQPSGIYVAKINLETPIHINITKQ